MGTQTQDAGRHVCVCVCVSHRNTPGLLNLTGATLLAATAALIYFVGDESTAEVALQAVGGLVLGGAGIAALVAASTLDDFQVCVYVCVCVCVLIFKGSMYVAVQMRIYS